MSIKTTNIKSAYIKMCPDQHQLDQPAQCRWQSKPCSRGSLAPPENRIWCKWLSTATDSNPISMHFSYRGIIRKFWWNAPCVPQGNSGAGGPLERGLDCQWHCAGWSSWCRSGHILMYADFMLVVFMVIFYLTVLHDHLVACSTCASRVGKSRALQAF